MTVKPTEEQDRINTGLINKAITALYKHHSQKTSATSSATQKESLLGDDVPVQLTISLLRVPSKPSPKPRRILIPHSLYDINDDGDGDLQKAEVCLIVKDESKPFVQDMIDKFPKEMGCIKKVLTLKSLRSKYTTHEQKQELGQRYNLFLVDERILPMVGKPLGKHFFQKKRQPIPIEITKEKALPVSVALSVKSTYLFLSKGINLTIRAGNTAMSPDKIIANCSAIIKGALRYIPGQWTNICNIAVKTPSSIALPIYNRTPEELAFLEGLDGRNKAPPPKPLKEKSSGDDGGEVLKEKKKGKRELTEKASPLMKALKKQKKSDVKLVEDVEAVKEKEAVKENLSSNVESEAVVSPKKKKHKKSKDSAADSIDAPTNPKKDDTSTPSENVSSKDDATMEVVKETLSSNDVGSEPTVTSQKKKKHKKSKKDSAADSTTDDSKTHNKDDTLTPSETSKTTPQSDDITPSKDESPSKKEQSPPSTTPPPTPTNEKEPSNETVKDPKEEVKSKKKKDKKQKKQDKKDKSESSAKEVGGTPTSAEKKKSSKKKSKKRRVE